MQMQHENLSKDGPYLQQNWPKLVA